MIGPLLRAGAWHAVLGLSAVAVVVGGVAAAIPKAGLVLLPLCFALLGGAAAFALDEPAFQVVDVAPTSAARRAAVRSLALVLPLAVGAVTGLVVAGRTGLPWAATALALIGTVVFGFTVACLARTRAGEPGAVASAIVVALMLAPALIPRVPAWLRTFPVPDSRSQPSNALWAVALVACSGLIAGSLMNRRPLRALRQEA